MLFDRKRWEPKEPVVSPEAPKAKPKRKLWQQMLLKAASYIQRHGWVQGRRYDYMTGAVCIMGALDALEAEGGVFTSEVRALAQRKLAPSRRDPGDSIIRFNDSEGTTKTAVLARLRQVAKGV